MEYPGLQNNNKSIEKGPDLIIADSVSKLPYNSKSGSIVEVVNKGVKKLTLDAIFPHYFYIHINDTSVGDIARTDDGKILSILENLEAVYYNSNNLKKIIHYLRVAILGLIYREYEVLENLRWKNLNNIKIFTFKSSKEPYLYNGEEWEKMDYVQKSDFAFDNAPTQDSSSLLTSGVIYNELSNKADLINGKVPSDLLPSYVDDVLEFPSIQDFPEFGESGKIYIDINANTSYRWTGSIYKEIQSPIELDEYPILGSTNAIESGGVYSALLRKLDIISDLPEIRLGAALGATALLSFTETDPTVPDWAKLTTKPSYTASEVGALPDSTVIPDDLSDLNDDATHRLVTDAEKTTWNGKQDALVSGTNIKTINNTSLLGSGNISVQTPLTFDSIPTTSSTNPVTSGGVATALTSYVTLSTSQNVTGEKTFVGTKKIKFKKSTANDKLGFTLYDNNNKELSYLEYNTGDLCLGSYYQIPSLQVKSRAGFKMSDVSSGINAVYRILTPYAADAKTPFNLTSTVSDFYFTLGVSNGTTTLVTNSTGLLDISSFFNNYYTKTDTDTLLSEKQGTLVSGTDIKTINDNTLLGSGNIYLNDAAISYDGNGAYALENASNVQEALDILDDAVNNIELNLITSITTSESSASGGNNTVTITETNGTSHTFNVKNGTDGRDGQDGADGVSLGEVALVQTTGDSDESVMSQKAVTEYGRKVTAEDLAGTSDWIKARLADLGWQLGKYLYTNTIKNNDAYCITPMIPISDIIGHSLTWEIGVVTNQIKLWFCKANGARTGYWDTGTASSSTRTITVTSSGISSAADATHLMISLSINNIPKCYVFDNTTGEYIFKGDDYLETLCNNLLIDYDVFHNTLMSQETGDSSDVTMSQKAITYTIEHSRSLTPCQCAFVKGNTYFSLSDEQCAALNNTGIISIICTRLSAWNPSYPTEWRYFRLRGASAGNTTDGFYIGCASHGRMYYQTYANNANNQAQADGANIYNGSKICPAVSVVVWDRINGIVKFYDRTTLITTKQSDEYKLSGFVGTNKYIYMFPGDDQSFLYDLQIYNYDIIGIVDTYINQLEGANYIHECYDGNLKKALSDWGDGGHSTYGNSTAIPYTYDGNTVIMTSTSSCVANSTTTQRGYYVGTTDVARLYESDIEVVSGECKINNRTPNIIEKIVDRDTGDVYSAGDTLGVGKYTICGRAMVVACWSLTYMSGDPMVVKHTANRQKYISCVMHLKCDTLYNGELYDDQADVFYNAGVSPSNTTFKYIRQSKSTAPNFAGQMAVSGNNIFVGSKVYTWKQINNS